MRLGLFVMLLIGCLSYGQDLERYRWKNRLVLIIQDLSSEQAANNQLTLFKKEESALQERAILVLHATPKQATQWKSRFGLEETFNGVLLIGKDGGLKFSDSFPVKPKTIFTLIDGMPMRKAEIRQQKKGL